MMNGLSLPLKNGPDDWGPSVYKYFPNKILHCCMMFGRQIKKTDNFIYQR